MKLKNLYRSPFFLTQSDVSYFYSPADASFQYYIQLTNSPGPMKTPYVDLSLCYHQSSTATTPLISYSSVIQVVNFI